MKKNGRVIILFLIFVILLGCSVRETYTVPVESDLQMPPSLHEWLKTTDLDVDSSKPITLGFSQLGSESAWRLANTASVLEAAEESGIHVVMKNAEQSQSKQFEAIRSFIQMKVDIIAIAPVVESGWEDILLEVKQAGIPVIILDRSVKVKDTTLFVTTIGSNFYDEGLKAGKYLIDLMSTQPSSIRIAELQGTSDSTPSIQRGEGFRAAIASRADVKIVQSAPAEFTEQRGKEVMRRFLQVPEHQRPHVLFAHNDDMAIGAAEAIREAGLQPGKDIIIISVDGSRRALEELKNGNINAVVECNPLLGPLLMQAAKEMMSGRTLPKRMVPPEDIITQVRAAIEVNQSKF